MNFRRFAALVGILAITGAAFQQARSADEPNKDAEPAKASAAGDFALRYAQANLRLAELTLQKAQEMNRRIPQTLAKGIIEQFADDVEFAKVQLDEAKRSGELDAYKLWIRRVELQLQTREDRLKIATDANRRVPGAFAALDLDRMRTAIELARLRVERGRSLSDASPEAKLAWQLEMMSEGLNRVDEMVSLSIQNRLSEFF